MSADHPRGADCVACNGDWPAAEQRIADFGATVAYLHDDQFFPGWTLLVLRRHATELFHLGRAARASVIEDVSAVGHALLRAFDAVKINYALLGNAVPHVHWHVIPRLASDPRPREPVWSVTHAPLRLADAERRARIDAIRAHLPR